MISLSQTVQALSVQQKNATSRRANVASTAGPPAALEEQRQANTLGIPPPGQEQAHQRIRESPERTAYTNTIIKDVIGVLPEYDPVRGNITSQQFISKTDYSRIEPKRLHEGFVSYESSDVFRNI